MEEEEPMLKLPQWKQLWRLSLHDNALTLATFVSFQLWKGSCHMPLMHASDEENERNEALDDLEKSVERWPTLQV